MPITGHDRLVDEVIPIAKAFLAPEMLRQRRALRHAISDDGYIEPEALLILGNLLVSLTLDDTQYNSTSTSAYTDMAAHTITLPDGVWTLYVLALSRGGHSAGTNIDFRLSVQNDAYNEITRSAPTASAAPFYTIAVVSSVPGEQEIAIAAQFKCDSGSTATMNDTVILDIALRSA